MKQNTLSVTTEPITLEGRYLGPFRIELDIRAMTSQPFYSIVAEDPHPSSPNSDVTHPHVNGDQLCEGEGTMFVCILAALTCCRFAWRFSWTATHRKKQSRR